MALLHSVILFVLLPAIQLLGFAHSASTSQSITSTTTIAARTTTEPVHLTAEQSALNDGPAGPTAATGSSSQQVFDHPVLRNTGTSTGSVIGYIWEADTGSPKFASVVVPAWALGAPDFAARKYEIYIFQNGSFVFYQNATALSKVTFPVGGVSKFEVLGIDAQLAICATDQNLTWEIQFSESGVFRGHRVPITSAVSSPRCVAALKATGDR